MMGKSLEQVLAEIQKPGRNVRLQMLHTLIGDLKPDALEAHDLIGSLAGVLARRYENPSEALSLAQKALERLDMGQEIDARDELDALDAYRLRRARREG
jgi:hypothetical protein